MQLLCNVAQRCKFMIQANMILVLLFGKYYIAPADWVFSNFFYSTKIGIGCADIVLADLT